MKRRLMLSGVTIFFAAIIFVPTDLFAQVTKTYTSASYGVQVSYPADWIDKGTPATDILNPDYAGPYNAFGFGPAMDGEVLVAVNPSLPMTRTELTKRLSDIFAFMDPALNGPQ